MENLHIYIGTGLGMEAAERAIYHSIVQNTSPPYTLHWMKAYGPDPMFNDWTNSPRPENINRKGYWVTPFSQFRYAVPELQGFSGRAVYLDVDMVVLGDLKDLANEYYSVGSWTIAENRDGDCVAVIDCNCVTDLEGWPTIQELREGTLTKHEMRHLASNRYRPDIPESWNTHDSFQPGVNLVHYTSIVTQPWTPYPDRIDYQPHPSQASVALFQYYANRPV